MTLRVGLIGCGVMGGDHARILLGDTPGAQLVAVQDADPARGRKIAGAGRDIRVFESARDLIRDDSVQAIIVASPDASHAELTIATIEARKPALCEKPLAATLTEARAVMAAEIKGGRRLVQVGFMRRFDPGYCAMKQGLGDETTGRPLFLHCVHRNAIAPDYITSDLVIANSAVHEFDIARFLLEEEFAAVSVFSARASRNSDARRPQFVVLESASGVVVTVEAYLDAKYGYDVQAELVCENSAISLRPHRPTAMRSVGWDGFAVESDWRGRFADAYRLQLKEWVRSIAAGRPTGASAWDGYAASATAVAALEALARCERTKIDLDPRPSFYDAAAA
ncbi:MAG TPA: Gfo/Idh/MocA family oxidoreductase [Roseiarcus sp.]|nr:Gfo/Idh/MocA family oxidoreductase [Roseiarcus sp.]